MESERGITMLPWSDEGRMTQREEKPVLTPLQRLQKVIADRKELERLKALEPKPKKRVSTDDLVNLIDKLLGE